MRISHIFSVDLLGTLIASGITGLIVSAITDLNGWTCFFIGYLVAELLSTANRVQAISTDLANALRRLDEASQAAARLEEQMSILQDEIRDQQKIA